MAQQMQRKPPLLRADMTGSNDLFGWRVIRRKLYEPLVEVYMDDDDNFHYVTQFSIHWAGELKDMADKLLTHGQINPGACEPLSSGDHHE